MHIKQYLFSFLSILECLDLILLAPLSLAENSISRICNRLYENWIWLLLPLFLSSPLEQVRLKVNYFIILVQMSGVNFFHLLLLGSQTQGNASTATSWLTSLFAPLFFAWNWVWARFFSNPPPRVTQKDVSSQPTTASQQQTTSHGYDYL